MDANKLRLMDFDDLCILRNLLDDSTMAVIARNMGLTQPAISQRMRKLEDVFGCMIVKKSGIRVHLTSEGRKIGELAKSVLSILETSD